MKDLSAHTQYAIDRIKNISFKRTSVSIVSIEFYVLYYIVQIQLYF